MNRRSRGFTLTELLTALVIHSFFILMLGGIFYTLISFGSRSQMTMTARERGQRVINYIDSRVRRAGLGMWKLEKSSEIRGALAPLTEGNVAKKGFNNNDKTVITLPVIVTYDDQDEIATDGLYNDKIKSEDNIVRGNVLTLLYAERETDKIFIIKNGGYAKMPSETLTTLPDNAKKLKGIFQTIQNAIYEYYASILSDKPIETIQSDEKQTIIQETFDEFWKKFLTTGITSASKKFDINVYNSIPNNQYEALLKSFFNMYGVLEDLNSSDDGQSNALKSMFKDLITYINTHDETNIFIPQITSILKPYSTFDPEFSHIFLTEEYNDSGKVKKYKEYPGSQFEEAAKNDKGQTDDLRSYAVLRGTGSPVIVNKTSLNLISCDPVLSGDELLYLKSVRVFAMNPTDYDKKHGQQLRNLKVQKLDGKDWGDVNPYQQGILEIYAELNTTESILTVWVLSTGGRDNMTHEKPADWPGRWREEGDNNDYKYFVTYVSKGTWKLNNLPENFTWD